MKLKTFAILLSLSTACSSATYAMNSDQEDRLTALQKQRQATIEKGRELQTMQAQLHEDGKRRMEEIKEENRKQTTVLDSLRDEGSEIMDAVTNGTMSLEEAERRISQLESKAQAK